MAFDDPLQIIRAQLAARPGLEDVPVVSRVPSPRPERLIRLVFTGATRRSLMHRDARVTIECWAPTDTAAYELAAVVEDAVTELDTPWAFVPGGGNGWVGGPAEQPDPDSGTPRVVMTAILRQRNRT